MTTHTNGDPLACALPPADLSELQRWARATLARCQDPHALPWPERQLLAVVSELARHRRRKAGKAPVPPAVVTGGEPCPRCGSMSMVRTGACLTCQACGESGGCG